MFGLAISIVTGSITLIPGCGILQAILIATFLGLTGMNLLLAVLSAIFFNCISQAIYSKSSGDVLTQSLEQQPKVEVKSMAETLLKCTLLGLLIGLAAAVAFGLAINPAFFGIGGTAIAFYIFGNSSNFNKLRILIPWMMLIAAVFGLLYLAQVPNIPSVLGVIVFSLPFGLNKEFTKAKDVPDGYIPNKVKVPSITLFDLIGWITSQIMAGISPELLTATEVSDAREVNRFLKCHITGAFIEGFGLGLLLLGKTSSRSLIGTYVGALPLGHLIVVLPAIFTFYFVLKALIPTLIRLLPPSFKEDQNLYMLYIGLISLLAICANGSVNMLFLLAATVVGCGGHILLRKLNLINSKAYGFTFIISYFTR